MWDYLVIHGNQVASVLGWSYLALFALCLIVGMREHARNRA
jgi:hypothetical protein